MAKVFQELTINFSAKKVRHEIMDGRKYLAAPAVLLTNDVHAGSNGPVLYTGDRLARSASVWDHKPIVIYHPQKDGKYTTACTPAVLESRGCGILLHTKYDNKLRTECWFDEEKTRRVDPRVYEALEQEKLTEASTGLFMDIEDAPGEFNGKPYVGVADNFAPDHYAILPDKIGACSIAAGGGLFQVNEAPAPLPADNAVIAKLRKVTGSLARIQDVYDGFFVFADSNGNLQKQGFTVNGDEVKLDEDTTPVKCVTHYQTETGTFVGNSSFQPVKEINVDKKQYVDFLITANVGWEEADRAILDGMAEPKLKTLYEKAQPPAPPPAPPAPTVNTTPPAPTPPISLPTPKPVTMQEFIANQVPPELRESFQEMVVNAEREKASLVQAITANKLNRFTPEWLGSQRVEVLRNLAAVAAPVDVQPNYSGMATMPLTGNDAFEQEPLAEIGLDFTKK